MALPLSVLLIEDDAMLAKAMSRALASLGCRVSAVSDVESARAILASAPDVVLADLNLGHAQPDGLAALALAREVAPTAMRAITSGSSDARVARALESGLAHSSLPKPVSLATLTALLDSARSARDCKP